MTSTALMLALAALCLAIFIDFSRAESNIAERDSDNLLGELISLGIRAGTGCIAMLIIFGMLGETIKTAIGG